MWKIKTRWLSQAPNSSSRRWKDHILSAFSTSGAFVQACFHFTFREKWIPLLLFAVAHSLCLCLSICNQLPSQGESSRVNWKLSRRHLSASFLSSVFTCKDSCHSSRRVLDKPINTGLFYIPDRLLSPVGLDATMTETIITAAATVHSLVLFPYMMYICILLLPFPFSYLTFSSSYAWRFVSMEVWSRPFLRFCPIKKQNGVTWNWLLSERV